MCDTTWATQQLIDFCPQSITDEASIYVQAMNRKIARILFLLERFSFSENSTLEEGSDKFLMTQIEIEIYVESIAYNLHSLADVLAQIINIIVLKPLLPTNKHFSSEDVTPKKIKTHLQKLNLDDVKRRYVDDIIVQFDNLMNSNEFSYVAGFVNTIKHRRLLNTVFHFELNQGSLLDFGFKLDPFQYKGINYAELSCKDFVMSHREKVINLAFELGHSVNNYCRAVFIANV
ncbi:MAG: hypothetical protein KME23_02690 [Goleter apudmare HA4340-LM2]|jgi:hypothetical protein|nr:hypothetical protein [Goleter apudmare HA4340-LM2]